MQQKTWWISILTLGLGAILVWFWNGEKKPEQAREFFVLYLDLSEATDYLGVIEQVEKLTALHPQNHYLFMSNGKNPVIAREESEKRTFIQAIQGTERLVPNVRHDLAAMQADSTLLRDMKGVENLQLQLCLSPTIHRLSGQILLDGLYSMFAPLSSGQTVQIITEKPITVEQQLQSQMKLSYHTLQTELIQ